MSEPWKFEERVWFQMPGLVFSAFQGTCQCFAICDVFVKNNDFFFPLVMVAFQTI